QEGGGVLGEDAGQCDAGAFAAGQRRERSSGQVGDVGGGQRGGDECVVVVGRGGVQPGGPTHGDDFSGREGESEAVGLGQDGAAAVHVGVRPVGEGVAFEFHGAGAGFEFPGECG